MGTILITGGLGQIGTELSEHLISKYGSEKVLVSDIKSEASGDIRYTRLDVADLDKIMKVIKENDITDIFHLAAILSATGEKDPFLTFNVNLMGTQNMYTVVKKLNLNKLFIPSTIGVYGPTTPKDMVPEDTVIRPATMYGITKISAEMLGEYYSKKFGMDVRGLRFPGLISYKFPPTAGTTDYAVDMIIHAVKGEDYTCYLKQDTEMPMMYMPDALDAVIDLYEAPRSNLTRSTDYNVGSYSITPASLYEEIKKYYPEFRVEYKPDYRQDIADGWPHSIDFTKAQRDWNFKPKYDFQRTVKDMVLNLKRKLKA
ncbi:NAD-dependent epimerase/dehydratase family protein [Oxyplasma meridianum]|uniref:NAD-dependent epimerase/dehydratase family protein n=1 Tax=Oxyplasma meridianum TaxID=3073602 RepID=A0AAX4NED5_9ARCH